MKLLAIDTATVACSVALLVDGEIKLSHQLAPMLQAKLILPVIEEMLTSNNINLNQLDAIAFGCGPGSFTGLRIAISVAQGLAFAAELPLISISSLAATAQSAYEELGWKKLLVALDARMNEVYYGAYQINSQGLAELDGVEVVVPPHKLALPTEKDWYGIGNGWEVYETSLASKPLVIDPSRIPMASGIATLAQQAFLEKKWINPAEAMPVYLRDNVAIKSQ